MTRARAPHRARRARAQSLYGKGLADVDWLHGGAESFLTLTNLFIVLGFRRAVAPESEAAPAGRRARAREGEGVRARWWCACARSPAGPPTRVCA